MALLTPDGLSPAPVALDESAPPPSHGTFTVSVDRFLAERNRWPAELQARAGVHLNPDEDVEALAALFTQTSLTVLTFSKMADGRPFSQARLLRKRIGYDGMLIARGPVIADQFDFLRRCGFDGAEIPPDAKPEVWLRALSRHRHHYQPDPARPRPASVAS